VSPAAPGCPVGFDTPAVLSGAVGVADMSRTVAGAAGPGVAVGRVLAAVAAGGGQGEQTIGMSADAARTVSVGVCHGKRP
jgi:hypothetical protein